ncbi:MAG: MmgE/PrpD family protein [Deltaproteobacteria bacterium]
MKKDVREYRSIVGEVSSYISGIGRANLPAEVITKAKQHVLDTLAAIVSGSKLKPGRLAKKYVKTQAGVKEAQVACSQIITSAINAAFANGIMAHADETDDSHARSFTHPGCAIIPAALAVSERQGVDGISFLKGVVVGYDIGCRITQALGVDTFRKSYRSSHSFGANFGAASAAASVLGLKGESVQYVLSYAAQQASGVTYWVHEDEHVEKAFVFSGIPARNGVTAALLIESGFTGVLDPFSGERNFFVSFSSRANPELLSEGLGSRYEIVSTNIKKFSVGSPIQAPLQAMLNLVARTRLKATNVEGITVRLGEGLRTVDNRKMPDINIQYILAVALLDGSLSFEAAHSSDRMKDRSVLKLRERITLVEDPELRASSNKRQGIVEVTTKDGTQLREHVVSVRGTSENPMTTEEVEKKCSELLKPVLGRDRTQRLIDKILNLEYVRNVRELRPLLSGS